VRDGVSELTAEDRGALLGTASAERQLRSPTHPSDSLSALSTSIAA
jgi:hypothetical protein